MNESYHCILPVFLHYECGHTVSPGVSLKAFLFGFLCQNEEMEGMLLRISYSIISFLLTHTCLGFLSFLPLLTEK